MTKATNIEKRWTKTVRWLFLVDFVVSGIVIYLFVNRAKGNIEFPSYKELSYVIVVIILGNTVIFLFMKAIKNTIKYIVNGD